MPPRGVIAPGQPGSPGFSEESSPALKGGADPRRGRQPHPGSSACPNDRPWAIISCPPPPSPDRLCPYRVATSGTGGGDGRPVRGVVLAPHLSRRREHATHQ